MVRGPLAHRRLLALKVFLGLGAHHGVRNSGTTCSAQKCAKDGLCREQITAAAAATLAAGAPAAAATGSGTDTSTNPSSSNAGTDGTANNAPSCSTVDAAAAADIGASFHQRQLLKGRRQSSHASSLAGRSAVGRADDSAAVSHAAAGDVLLPRKHTAADARPRRGKNATTAVVHDHGASSGSISDSGGPVASFPHHSYRVAVDVEYCSTILRLAVSATAWARQYVGHAAGPKGSCIEGVYSCTGRAAEGDIRCADLRSAHRLTLITHSKAV
jgi:hypothetical protein